MLVYEIDIRVMSFCDMRVKCGVVKDIFNGQFYVSDAVRDARSKAARLCQVNMESDEPTFFCYRISKLSR